MSSVTLEENTLRVVFRDQVYLQIKERILLQMRDGTTAQCHNSTVPTPQLIKEAKR